MRKPRVRVLRRLKINLGEKPYSPPRVTSRWIFSHRKHTKGADVKDSFTLRNGAVIRLVESNGSFIIYKKDDKANWHIVVSSRFEMLPSVIHAIEEDRANYFSSRYVIIASDRGMDI